MLPFKYDSMEGTSKLRQSNDHQNKVYDANTHTMFAWRMYQSTMHYHNVLFYLNGWISLVHTNSKSIVRHLKKPPKGAVPGLSPSCRTVTYSCYVSSLSSPPSTDGFRIGTMVPQSRSCIQYYRQDFFLCKNALLVFLFFYHFRNWCYYVWLTHFEYHSGCLSSNLDRYDFDFDDY